MSPGMESSMKKGLGQMHVWELLGDCAEWHWVLTALNLFREHMPSVWVYLKIDKIQNPTSQDQAQESLGSLAAAYRSGHNWP